MGSVCPQNAADLVTSVGPGSPSEAGDPSPALETAPSSSSQNINTKTLTHSLLCIYSFTPSIGAGEMVLGSSSLSHRQQRVMKNVTFSPHTKVPVLFPAQPCAVPYGMLQKPLLSSKFPGRNRGILSKQNIGLWEGLFEML